MDFIKDHIQLKNPKILFDQVTRVADNLLKDGTFDKIDDAVMSACILVSFQVAGKKILKKEEILKYADQIYQDCLEYAKENGETK